MPFTGWPSTTSVPGPQAAGHGEALPARAHWLGRVGYDPVYGARPLKRLIQQEVETPMARQLVKGELRDGDSAVVDVKDDRIVVIPVVETKP